MRIIDVLQLLLFFLILVCLIKPMGLYLHKVLNPKGKTFLDPVVKPLERLLYRWLRIDPFVEQNWKGYLVSVMGFSLMSVIFTWVLLGAQRFLPFNPEKLSSPSWYVNLNTAVSFMTNTDWQVYSGETTMSYFSQMAALSVQNFVSAAVGLCAAAALVRGIARKQRNTIGNFWTDLVRINLYLLLPLSILVATLFMWGGTPQNFKPYVHAHTLETGKIQKIVQGPMASQEAIKILGSNGGGFTNANSAHPYENPNPLMNHLQLLLIFLIPAAQIYYFGYSIKNEKHAWCICVALMLVFIGGLIISSCYEKRGNPEFISMGMSPGNWEGKEQRFGIFGSTFYACATTAVSCGATNCSHDSLTPIGGLIPMLNIQLGEVIFGGLGSGLYSVLLFVFLAIFISGLIIGRTPEYLGKKIESYDIKMTMMAVIPFVLIIHGLTALSCFDRWGLKEVLNAGPHGFSEILYAFSSCAGNNGSAFAGLTTNGEGYSLALALAMLLGRFCVLAPVMALAGSFAKKKMHPKSSGSFPVSSLIFISLLVGVIFLLGALTFLPALAMGPIIEQFSMLKRGLFS